MIQKEWDSILATMPLLELPEGFLPFWQEQKEKARNVGKVQRIPHVCGNEEMAVYKKVTFSASDGQQLYARYIRPAGSGKFPLVLMFHDADRPVRGWHHMTRFIALGYSVFALQNRETGSPQQHITDALSAAHVALQLRYTDPDRVYAWGEGLGGTLAIAVSALFDVAKCAAQNPLCSGSYAACACFASLLKAPFLMATSGMDSIAPPENQLVVYSAVQGPKGHYLYPKYVHERINAFEDRLIVFLHPAVVI